MARSKACTFVTSALHQITWELGLPFFTLDANSSQMQVSEVRILKLFTAGNKIYKKIASFQVYCLVLHLRIFLFNNFAVNVGIITVI